MIIYFEGLAFGGKTTLLRELSTKENFFLIQEYIIDEPMNYVNCKKNDEVKCESASSKNGIESIILVDRSYVSTLVYTYLSSIFEKTSNVDDCNNRVSQGIKSGKLILPDYYCFVDVNEETAMERGSMTNRLDNSMIRYHNFALTKSLYKEILKKQNVEIIELDGNKTTNDLVIYMINLIKGKSII